MSGTIVFIEANTSGTGMLALHTTRAMGLSPLFLTSKPARYAGLEPFQDAVIVCDTNDLAALRTTIEEFQSTSAAPLAGITTTSEFYIETVAVLCQEYSLPGNPPAALHACRNKAHTRTALAAAGIHQPHFAIFPPDSSLTDLPAQLETIGLPCVVKPADDSGSNEVLLCRSFATAQAQIEHIWTLTRNVRSQPTAATALVEQYLAEPEYSVEMFVWNDTCVWIGVTEKHVAGLPYFVEHRHIFPAPLTPAITTHICTAVEQAIRTLGLRLGPIHTEIKLTPQGCAIIEVNARLAGGMIPELIRLTTDIDLLEQQLYAATNQRPQLEGQPKGYAGIQFLLPKIPGQLQTIEGADQAKAVAGVHQVAITAKPHQPIQLARSAYDRLGFVIATGATPEIVDAALMQALASLSVQLAPSAASL